MKYSAKYFHENSPGTKRFVVLIYEQKSKLKIDKQTNYKSLVKPLAGTFYYVQYPRIHENYEYPENCAKSDQNGTKMDKCVVRLNFHGIQDGFIQFIVKLKLNEKFLDLGFFDDNQDFIDVIQITSTGRIVDSHMNLK